MTIQNKFEGFSRRVRSIPVPSPMFGLLLEKIDDLAEFKTTLRVMYLLQEKKGFPRFLTHSELLADRTLVQALATDGQPDHERIELAVQKAVDRGTLVSAVGLDGDQEERLYMVNTEQNRVALASMVGPGGVVESGPSPEPWECVANKPNVFAMYEANIGLLSPMVADELREAEELYPEEWIEDAFREAVSQNKRSWRYISRILERWDTEGRNDGKPGRNSKKSRRY
jgi:DNA replication protein